jgi:hypothetical protein
MDTVRLVECEPRWFISFLYKLFDGFLDEEELMWLKWVNDCDACSDVIHFIYETYVCVTGNSVSGILDTEANSNTHHHHS